MVLGGAGPTGRRRPARLQGALVPGGFALTAPASAAVGLALRGGGSGGPGLYVAFAGVGAGPALGFSPTLTGALATVRPEDAADAGGLLVTVTQLGRLLGMATFGTLFLNRLNAPGAYAYADALWVCALASAAASVFGAAAGLLRPRR
ncbi:hypothetical protein [Streptomyces enissocaesilis]|uniref:Major facilitator superfamily (MFS) profile domain-containing protein n=1 Tax=Streptomyces enissocaesilis TaxID=332589 RepID=A0ABP6JYY2_9ACTN